jgi:hypothetical protein
MPIVRDYSRASQSSSSGTDRSGPPF